MHTHLGQTWNTTQPLSAEEPAEIRAALGPREALVDLIFYAADGDDRLAVFLVLPDQKVKRLELGTRKEVDALVGAHVAQLRGGDVDSAWMSQKLRIMLWEPIEPYLGTADRILVCADGVLAALPRPRRGARAARRRRRPLVPGLRGRR